MSTLVDHITRRRAAAAGAVRILADTLDEIEGAIAEAEAAQAASPIHAPAYTSTIWALDEARKVLRKRYTLLTGKG